MSSSMAYEPVYVLDTHALIWYLQDNPLLSVQARAICKAAERGETRLHISSISLTEIYYANQKYHWFPDFRSTFGELKRMPYLRLVAFEADDVLDFQADSAVPEMYDRMIVGLARRLNAPLVTADAQITASKVTVVVW